ncbi:hypothetical protein CMO89_01765 [Candidatus Woesearchaeota archaeon]|nr:hypothetical protein [Candidatus Woesearchaeota archaeon]|tara:strand:- start:4498 stop:4971 length:474 start_codon:yes stop_codon:yes gene_type:complete
MKNTISKDTPLAEIVLRRYEKPDSFSDRELIRKLCLSIGLLQPGDSRDIVVDVFYVMLKNKGKELSSENIKELVIKNRKEYNLVLLGIASSNIRRQLKRLRDIFLIEKVANSYRISENSMLSDIFKEKLERFLFPSIVNRVSEYFKVVDEKFYGESE